MELLLARSRNPSAAHFRSWRHGGRGPASLRVEPEKNSLEGIVRGYAWVRREAGRYLQVVYVPDTVGDGAFVVTAFDLTPKARRAFRRRQRRKRK